MIKQNNHLRIKNITAASVLFISLIVILSVGVHADTESDALNIAQLMYKGGNWNPRPSATLRLSFEVQKRTAIKTRLEPYAIKPELKALAMNPVVYLSGDRGFDKFSAASVSALSRYLKMGGTIIIDPAYDDDGNIQAFKSSIKRLIKRILPNVSAEKVGSDHVLFRAFYDLKRPVGLKKGSGTVTGYRIGKRLAIIVGDHDWGGAYARDNLGNWKFDIEKGGSLQRENAFRFGINLIMYAVCGDYKNEKPHKQFTRKK